MRATIAEIRQVIREAATPWVVRGGSVVFARKVDEPARSWREWTLTKVTYFTNDELVKRPKGPTDDTPYVFKRDGMVYAVRSNQFYARPV